jgi:hypothetical protein
MSSAQRYDGSRFNEIYQERLSRWAAEREDEMRRAFAQDLSEALFNLDYESWRSMYFAYKQAREAGDRVLALPAPGDNQAHSPEYNKAALDAVAAADAKYLATVREVFGIQQPE